MKGMKNKVMNGKENFFRAAILTLSDKGAKGEREDKSGKVIEELVASIDARVVYYKILPDEMLEIESELKKLCDNGEADIVITTGGTGLSKRDVTPEATLKVIERRIPGFEEAMRAASITKTPHGMLSRGVAGIRNQTIIVNLPGSPKGVRENLEVILPALPHGIKVLKGIDSECGGKIN